MHAANLAVECENMRLMSDLCHSLESIVTTEPQADGEMFGKEDAA
jgi:hypothetical protein